MLFLPPLKVHRAKQRQSENPNFSTKILRKKSSSMPDKIIMTREEAEQYHWLVSEIAMCKQSLTAIEADEKQWERSPSTLKVLAETRRLIEKRIRMCQEQCERFEIWLAGVSDPQVKEWLYARCVENLSWVQIAVQDSHMSTDAIRRRVSRYFEKEAKK